MPNLKERAMYATKAMNENRDKHTEIFELYVLMEAEIDDGESPDNEFEKFKDNVEELINAES